LGRSRCGMGGLVGLCRLAVDRVDELDLVDLMHGTISGLWGTLLPSSAR